MVNGIKIRIEAVNLPEFEAALERDAKQARFALAVALTRTARDARDDVRMEMQRVFRKDARRWFLNSVRFRKATKDDLVAYVGWKDPWGWRSSSHNLRAGYMVLPHIEGGERGPIGVEIHLRRAGILRSDEFLVPGRAILRNGRVPNGMWIKLLSGLRAHPDPRAWSHYQRRRRRGGAITPAKARDWRVNRHAAKGRVRGLIMHRMRGRWVVAFLIVAGMRYRKRFDPWRVVRATEARVFARHFDEAWAMALRTAR